MPSWSPAPTWNSHLVRGNNVCMGVSNSSNFVEVLCTISAFPVHCFDSTANGFTVGTVTAS
eukprot:m.54287 g.54287  ORF g.54287 m.54287 type:complete len:61 (-) comp15506_c0_seq1:703-885(-)